MTAHRTMCGLAVVMTVALLSPAIARAQRGGGSAHDSAARAAPAPRIIVEPDFLATRDGEVPHVETMIAVNPRNPRNLVGGAITLTTRDGTWGCKAYASLDGGRAWTPSVLTEQVVTGGGDPQVAFTPDGTALFSCLAFVKDDTGTTRAALQVKRSEDGGLSWLPAADLGYSYDHPMLAVDHTTGRFAGRAYIGVLYGREYNIGVFRSDDDGRTWTGPVRLHSGKTIGANVLPLVVFSDGQLLVPIVDFPLDVDPNRAAATLTTWTALSDDGGVSFSPIRRVLSTTFRTDTSVPTILLSTPAFAVDASDRHKDRVYVVWNDFGADGRGRPRILLQYSDDRGRRWSKPVVVDSTTPANARQFNAVVAVNQDGVVGVSWYDTRAAGDSLAWYEYFAASVDGGATFLHPVRVSSEPSLALGAGNVAVIPELFRQTNQPLDLAFLSAASRWANGGDYAGLTADRDGVFHPFWADGRSGTFQAWTARVRVERNPPSDAPAIASSAVPTDVTARVEIVADPSHYDPATHELELNLRLENTSDRTIRGPIVVTVQRFGSSEASNLTESERAREREQWPTVLNATNGKAQDGATMDYTAALGSAGVLRPGMRSGAVRWRLKVRDPVRIPDAQLRITGVVEGASR